MKNKGKKTKETNKKPRGWFSKFLLHCLVFGCHIGTIVGTIVVSLISSTFQENGNFTLSFRHQFAKVRTCSLTRVFKREKSLTNLKFTNYTGKATIDKYCFERQVQNRVLQQISLNTILYLISEAVVMSKRDRSKENNFFSNSVTK